MDGQLKGGAKTSTAQKLYLLEYLEAKPDIANDKFIGVDGAHCRDKEWSILAEMMNNMGGAIKDAQKWRKSSHYS